MKKYRAWKRKLIKKIDSITLAQYVCISLGLVLIMTLIVLVLTTIFGNLYDTIYTIFCSVFGAIEVIAPAIIKIFKIKGEKEDE